ncbi:MAG: hypothetical protein ABI867_01030 [Kofleriaceae bacterium]
MMAIVSKAVFEKAAGKAPKVGVKLAMDRYVSANKNLDRLSEGGTLYLVTVRPPDEALWLVAILDQPKFDGSQWVATASSVPITDISELRDQLKFESGKGITAAKGALGMSLQTPRAVTAEDARLLDAAATGAPAAPAAPSSEGFPDAPPGAMATGGGNRRQLLLAAVIADPDNEGARQVYADALAAANDPRGELITIDIALAGPLSIRKREALARRKAALLELHAKTWFPYRLGTVRLHHGFLTAVAGSLHQLEAVAPSLFAAEPITEVQVRGLRDTDLPKLLAASWLPRIHRLTIRGKLGDGGFATLVRSPAVAKLRSLNVTGTDLGADALAALQANLPECRTLVLSSNPIGDGGMRGLAAWQHVGGLETLYLGKCQLSAKGVDTLLGARLAKLAKLALTSNELGNAVGKVFANHSTQLPALMHLELKSTGIGAAGAQTISAAPFPVMRRLDVRLNRIDTRIMKDDPRITA